MPLSISRRALTTSLIVFSGVAALMSAGARPTSSAVYRGDQAGEVLVETTVHPLNVALAVWSVIVAVLAGWATVAYLRGQLEVVRRLLLIVGVMGLVPGILPGLSALAARAFIIREK